MARIPYCGAAPLPSSVWGSWNFDPVLLNLLVLASLWGIASLRLSPSSRRLWLGGMGVLFIAFVSPLCALTNALFAARAVHHVLLVAVAAPLLAGALEERVRLPQAPLPALLMATAALWLWHWPPAYAAALSSSGVYWLMQVALLGTSVWFWLCVLSLREAPIQALLCVLGAMVQMGLLGAILTFAGDPFYAQHWATTPPFGLSPLEDQQLAGLIMWVPAMLPYGAMCAIIIRRTWAKALAPA